MAASSSPFATRRALLALIMCAALHSAHAASWQAPADVIYVDAGSPVPRADAEAAIRYALASWSARVDLPLHWSTAPADPSYTLGSIVIRWSDTSDPLGTTSNLLSLASTRRWIYPSSGAIAAAEIQLRRAAFAERQSEDCFRHVVLHEIGHALGLGHLPDPHAVMNSELRLCHHTLTEADISAAPYPQHLCHAELLPDSSIYIPVIAVGARSFASRLRFDAGTWSVAEYVQVPVHPECDDTWLEGGDLVLARLWSAGQIWHAELQAAGALRWTLKPGVDGIVPTK